MTSVDDNTDVHMVADDLSAADTSLLPAHTDPCVGNDESSIHEHDHGKYQLTEIDIHNISSKNEINVSTSVNNCGIGHDCCMHDGLDESGIRDCAAYVTIVDSDCCGTSTNSIFISDHTYSTLHTKSSLRIRTHY